MPSMSQKITDFMPVVSTERSAFARSVANFIREGWRPYGPEKIMTAPVSPSAD